MVSSNSLDPNAIHQCWATHDYHQAEHLHRQAIDADPEGRSHYWHLGLALLLQGREEEAQMTWMMPLMEAEPEQVDRWTMELLEVLDSEASRLGADNLEMAWLIRQHIREMAPNQINNTLLLLLLSIKQNKFDSTYLNDWDIVQGLRSPTTPVYGEVVAATLNALLGNGKIDQPVIPMIQAAVPYLIDHLDRVDGLVSTIMQTANRIAFAQKKPKISVSLGEICLSLVASPMNSQGDADRRQVLMQLSSFYQGAGQYDDAIAVAQECYDLSKTNPEKIAALNRCLMSQMLTGGDWHQGYAYFQQQQDLLRQFLQHPPATLERTNVLRLINSVFFQPYFHDNPRQNRRVHNQVMAFCQAQLQRIHSDRIVRYQGRSHSASTENHSLENRPLKIGYLSHCLKRHSVGWIVRWLLQHHDRNRINLYLYLVGSDAAGIDPMQDWFIGQADVAHRLPADPMAIADQIYDDQIDILVDLDSITLDATCEVLALKPAPIQVSWLGWDAPGLPTVDYYLVDPYVVPDNADDDYVEKLWRLPQTYVAVDGFEVGVPSLRRDDLDIPADAMVYLSTQRGHKLHPDSARLQLQIIKAVPNSYLLVKLSGQEDVRKTFWFKMADEVGVMSDRLRFLPDVPSELTHRAHLRLADVVLDTYPYNGATTTLETLWMELPLVTRVGQQFSSRNSYTMMLNAGIQEGIAWTDDEYIDWAIRFGIDEDLRLRVSYMLRRSRQTAPLWNAKQFTHQMEDAYQQMWGAYLESRQ